MVLLVALLRVRTAPKGRFQLSPYEMLYERPFVKTKYCNFENYTIKELDSIKCMVSRCYFINHTLVCWLISPGDSCPPALCKPRRLSLPQDLAT